jgi:hypothetical protein
MRRKVVYQLVFREATSVHFLIAAFGHFIPAIDSAIKTQRRRLKKQLKNRARYSIM